MISSTPSTIGGEKRAGVEAASKIRADGKILTRLSRAGCRTGIHDQVRPANRATRATTPEDALLPPPKSRAQRFDIDNTSRAIVRPQTAQGSTVRSLHVPSHALPTPNYFSSHKRAEYPVDAGEWAIP